MTSSIVRVLFIGLDPALMDGGEVDPARPGPDAAKIQAGIDFSMSRLGALGYEAVFCPIDEGATAETAVRQRLAGGPFHCVVIGAGVRLIVKHTALLERLVAIVRQEASGAVLAFNTTPSDTAEAVQRWFPPPGAAVVTER